MKIKIIALDFDGVINDSVYECYLLTLEAFNKMGGKLEKSKELEKNFRKARAFVISAYDYHFISMAIQHERKDFGKVTVKEFDKLREKYNKGKEEFFNNFYKARKDWRERNMKKWVMANKTFPQASDFKRISRKYKTLIATTRDKESALLLLKEKGFDYKESGMLSREDGTSKTEHMKKIMGRFSVKPGEILFIEDMFESAKKTNAMGVKAVLVSWGYSNQAQRDKAKKMGIPIIKNDKVFEQIEGLL